METRFTKLRTYAAGARRLAVRASPEIQRELIELAEQLEALSEVPASDAEPVKIE
jgi:hypothetical protein